MGLGGLPVLGVELIWKLWNDLAPDVHVWCIFSNDTSDAHSVMKKRADLNQNRCVSPCSLPDAVCYLTERDGDG